MHRKEEWIQKLTGNSLPGIPILELAGDRRVLVECHCGVTKYGRDEVGVRVKYGFLVIKGSGLCLSHMSKERLVISGRIDSVELIRREKHGRNE